MRKRAISAVFVLSLISVFLGPLKAQALSGDCSLNAGKFEEINTIQNDLSLNYFSRIKKELGIRKNLLEETLHCLIAEMRALEGELQKVRIATPEAQALRAQFSEWFPNALNYYELQNMKIKDLGLEGSKSFARGLTAWREGNYKPTAKLITNFILWAQNQELVQAARSRLYQAGVAIEALRIAPEYWEAKAFLREAETEFRMVSAMNAKAYEALRAYDPSGTSLEAIKLTLDSLALTYKKVLRAAELIATPKEQPST